MTTTNADSRRLRLAPRATVAALTIVISACGGGSDDAESTSADDASGTVTAATAGEETADGVGGSGADGGDAGDAADVTDLSATRACLEGLGVSVEPADESNTAMSPEMNASLGIEAMLVFDKGAGWGGSIEAYASTAEADVAEAGYIDSPFGFEVGRVDDIVFKTTGPVDDIAQIEGCLTGAPVAPSESTLPDDESSASGVGSDASGGDVSGARAGIVDSLIDPDLEAQGVIFDRACLETWVVGLSDADAVLLDDNGGDTEDPGVSADGVAQAELVLTCLDLDALAVRYAEELPADVACVTSAFAALDLDAAVAQADGDIDQLFNTLATTTEGCA